MLTAINLQPYCFCFVLAANDCDGRPPPVLRPVNVH